MGGAFGLRTCMGAIVADARISAAVLGAIAGKDGERGEELSDLT